MVPDQRHAHAVLVVDDYDDLRDALVVMLQSEGCIARGAASGSEALTLLAGGYRPCLVLLDVQMPELDGWEVCRQMRADPETADIPVVMLSGDVAVIEAHEQHVAGMLAKPVPSEELLAAIAEHAQCPRQAPKAN